MMLLAVLNPEATGATSDDGFRIGQLTLGGTVNLLVVGGLLGVLGGAVYAVVRPLLIGPRWFQIGSLSTGVGIVVGAPLVHTDGVDFRLLDPAWLAIALFVAIPALYAALLTVLAERWLSPSAWPSRTRVALVHAPLLALLPAPPLALALLLGWLVLHGIRRVPLGRRALAQPMAQWAARAVLAVVFVVAARDLADDVAVLV